jgi:hypothetical protein
MSESRVVSIHGQKSALFSDWSNYWVLHKYFVWGRKQIQCLKLRCSSIGVTKVTKTHRIDLTLYVPFSKFHIHTKHLQVCCCVYLDPPQIRTNISRNEWASWELIFYVVLSRIEFLFVSFVLSSQWTLFSSTGLSRFHHISCLYSSVLSKFYLEKSLDVHIFWNAW